MLRILVFVVWIFEMDYLDTLEYKPMAGGEWQQVVGPYSVDGAEYRVNADHLPNCFFRVKRVFGTPNIP